jgi:hypothetical protein
MTRVGIYCRRCFRFVRHGAETELGGLVWLDEPCEWCAERERVKRAEVQRLEELWAARECAAPDCSEVFTPARVGQRFHDERCRKRTHRHTKAASRD